MGFMHKMGKSCKSRGIRGLFGDGIGMVWNWGGFKLVRDYTGRAWNWYGFPMGGAIGMGGDIGWKIGGGVWINPL